MVRMSDILIARDKILLKVQKRSTIEALSIVASGKSNQVLISKAVWRKMIVWVKEGHRRARCLSPYLFRELQVVIQLILISKVVWRKSGPATLSC